MATWIRPSAGRPRAWQVVALAVSVTATLAACSSTNSTANSTPSGAPVNAAGVAQATALINQYLAEPTFTSPGPSFDAKKAAGKKIYSVPANSAVPFVNTVDQIMGQYARKLGINYTSYTNQQQQSQWVQGMNQAVSAHANLIDLLAGIPPELLAPQIQQATSAGIPTMDTNERDPSQTQVSYIKAWVFAPFKQAGQLMGAWAVSQTKGKADILVVTSNADVSSQAVQSGVNAEVQQTCPSCKITAQNVNPVDWATKLQSTVEGALAADPNINYILPVFDSMSQFIVPAIIGKGRTGSVHIASFNGTPAILDLMRTGKIVNMDVGENTSDVAAAALDQAMRVMLGLPAGNETITPRVLDLDNVSQAGVPAQSGQGYGDAFLNGYAQTWGVPASSLG